MYSDSESEEDLSELVACPSLYKEIIPKSTKINNKVALENAYIRIKNNLPWIERLDVITEPAPAADKEMSATLSELDPDDDFKREAYFYRVVQAGVLKALPRLNQLEVPTTRPTDFYAQMIKTDHHMTKIRQNLVVSAKRIEFRERARQLREGRKFGKRTQHAALETKRAEKKQLDEAVKNARKKRGDGDRTKMLNQILGDFSKDDIPQSNRQKKKQNETNYNTPKGLATKRKLNKNRDYKNKQFGHGGQKKRSKRNTKESAGQEPFNRSVYQSTSKAHADTIRKKEQQLRAARMGKGKGRKLRK